MQQVYVTAGGSPAPSPALPRVQNISCVLPATDDHGGLYIGNYFGAVNVDVLKEYGIRAVLTTSVETPVSYSMSEIPFHRKVDAHDKENFSIMDHLDECLEFIEKHRQLTNVFVHCYAGMSRSATVVLAYLMRNLQWPYEAALSFLRWKRSIVNPNQGFAQQLKHYQRMLGIVPKGLQQVIKEHMIQQQPRLESSMAINGRSAQIMGPPGGIQQMSATIPLPSTGQLDKAYDSQHRTQPTFLEVPGPTSSPSLTSRGSSVEAGKLALGQGSRPPSQQPTRAPSAKTLPLYERSPNKEVQPPTLAPRPQRTLHEDTPIPNFLQKKTSAKSSAGKDNTESRYATNAPKTNESKELRASKIGIRPRDLPGYRMN